jgi:uncharacterized protein YndB with AHSA1/START domain
MGCALPSECATIWSPDDDTEGGTRMNDVIEHEVRIEAPIERVWQIITDPAYVAKWFGSTAEIDPRPGGPVLFVESGFADETHYMENTEGWTAEPAELADLVAFVSSP